MTKFTPFPKIPRLNRQCVVTEKIDGTNASVYISPYLDITTLGVPEILDQINGHQIMAGSRTRWLTTGADNYGFARWVKDNAEELVKLGPGHHFGEWWGCGINRGYGLSERRFSLFNRTRWADSAMRPACCHVVPLVYEGPFCTFYLKEAALVLQNQGSLAAPGFMDPEGVVVYHTAGNVLFKATIKGDEQGKESQAHPKKEKAPRAPRDPNKGGRRIGLVPISFPDRRKSA